MQQEEPKTSNEEKADFCRLLKQILAKEIHEDMFLSDPVLNRRLMLICQSVTRNKDDAEEIANTVRYKIAKKIAKFKPDYEKPDANFFAWLRTIARRTAIDFSRPKSNSILYVNERAEELRDIHDQTINVAEEFDRQAAVRRFEAKVKKSDEQTQAIMKYYLEDYSLREIAELSEIQCSHVTVRKRVRDFLAEFFAEEDKLLAANVDRKDDQPSGAREKGDQTSELEEESDTPSARKTGS